MTQSAVLETTALATEDTFDLCQALLHGVPCEEAAEWVLDVDCEMCGYRRRAVCDVCNDTAEFFGAHCARCKGVINILDAHSI